MLNLGGGGKATTSQAKQPLALKIIPNENIKDICSSFSNFKLQIASSSEMKGGRISKAHESSSGALGGSSPAAQGSRMYGETGKH